MSDASQGPGWWMASDGKWYPPQGQPPALSPGAPPAPPVYPPPAAPGYQAPPAYAAAPPAGVPNAPEALWSLILGIVSLVCCGFLAGIPAIILGSSAKKKITASGGTLGGEGMAKVGIILGWISIGLTIIGVLIWIIALATGNGSVHVNTYSNN